MNDFLYEYREHLQEARLLLGDLDPDFLDPPTLTAVEQYVVDQHELAVLKQFIANMQFMGSTLIDVEKRIIGVYDGMIEKLKRLDVLAEGYQKFNLSDDATNAIQEFKVYNLQDRSLYDPYLQGLALPRKGSIKGLTPVSVQRANTNAIETFKLPSKRSDSLIKLAPLDPANTVVRRYTFMTSRNIEIKTVVGTAITQIPANASKILVYTDNVDKAKAGYTSLELLQGLYTREDTVTLNDQVVNKVGNTLKLVIEHTLPTETDCTCTLTVRSQGLLEGETKTRQETVEFNLRGDTFKESDSSYLKYLGNKVFDISGIPHSTFSITLSFKFTSITDDTKTPIIKEVYSYVSPKRL